MPEATGESNFLDSYEIFLLFLSFVFVQLSAGKYIAFGFLLFFFLIRFLKFIRFGNMAIRVDRLFIVCLWVVVIMNLVKINQYVDTELYIQLSWLIMGAAIFSSVLFINSLDTKKVYDTLVTVTSLMGLFFIICYIFKIEHVYFVRSPYAGTRMMGGVDGPNELATFYLFPFVYSFSMLLHFNVSKRKYAINALITGAVITMTWSRGGILGVVFVLFVSITTFLGKRLNIKRIIWVVIILFSLFVLIDNFLFDKYFVIRVSASSRMEMVSEIFNTVKRKPVLGYGLGSINRNSFIRNTTPHNGFLLILYSGGIVGFSFYLLFLGFILGKIFKRKDYINLLLFLSFLLQEMTFNHLVRGRVSLLAWLLICLVFYGEKIGSESYWLP